MSSSYEVLQKQLKEKPGRWLVTGAAGFIGSHLVEELLNLGQVVVGFDNFATGYQKNIDAVLSSVPREATERFTFIEGDIRELADCSKACSEVDYVLHQAALGSVPRSIKDPATSTAVNIDGFVNIMLAARDAGVKRFVFASSSSVYGDAEGLPKVESVTGNPLSPYAVTKSVNEMFASVFQSIYGIQTVGLRYFNVFGPRQDPEGAYAAVIPRWVAELLRGEVPQVFGDGETSRDFCYVKNAVQANLLAACVENDEATGKNYNVSFGGQTTLNELYKEIVEGLAERTAREFSETPEFANFRDGDVRHSRADISLAKDLLGYLPSHSLADGLSEALEWYIENASTSESS